MYIQLLFFLLPLYYNAPSEVLCKIIKTYLKYILLRLHFRSNHTYIVALEQEWGDSTCYTCMLKTYYMPTYNSYI